MYQSEFCDGREFRDNQNISVNGCDFYREEKKHTYAYTHFPFFLVKYLFYFRHRRIRSS